MFQLNDLAFLLYAGGSTDLFECVHAFSHCIFCALSTVMWQDFLVFKSKNDENCKLSIRLGR